MMTALNVFVAFAVILASTALYYIVLCIRESWKLRAFRGPPAFPFIGNCYTPQVAFLLRFVTTLRKSYGKIFTLFLFSKAYLVVVEPTVVRRILSDTKAFTKGKDYTESFAVLFGKGLVTSVGEKHRKDRAIFNKYFMRSNVLTKTGVLNALTRKTINQLLIPHTESGKPYALDIAHFFAVLSLRSFTQFAMNFDYSDNLEREEDICQRISDASCNIGWMLILSFPRLKIIPFIKSLMDMKTELGSDVMKQMEKRKKLVAAGEWKGEDDCVTAMLNSEMKITDVEDHAVSMIGAGHDTTAYFAAYFCLLLAEHPEIQDKLRKAVFEQLGDREEVTGDDIVAIKYLHQVMQEVLRMYAIIPSMTRYSTEEVVIKSSPDCDEVIIPKNTNIYIPMYLLNRDPSIWVNPTKFDPDRFADMGDYTNARAGFFPFGYGSRTCIGNTLAQIEVAIFMSHLIRQFSFETEPGFKVKITAGISLTTSNGVRVIIKKL
jgi:cytochrome P450